MREIKSTLGDLSKILTSCNQTLNSLNPMQSDALLDEPFRVLVNNFFSSGFRLQSLYSWLVFRESFLIIFLEKSSKFSLVSLHVLYSNDSTYSEFRVGGF